MSNNKNTATPADVAAAAEAKVEEKKVPNQVTPETETVTEEVAAELNVEKKTIADRLKNITDMINKNKKVLVALGVVATVATAAILKAKNNLGELEAPVETDETDEVEIDAV